MRKIPTERFWLDHVLATLSGVMAVYAVGQSVGSDSLPRVLAIVVLLAGLAGYGISLIVEDTKVQKADGWLFAIGAIVGVFQTRTINGMLPDEGFPFAIIAATMMFILLVVGGVFAWSDATLLFTSLPALVLFGLVGTIDSWRPALFLFCGMILGIALLYARVHQRIMVCWAEEGGADRRYLHRDVWKWVAGPEYAFAAAGTIILLSFVGAPVVQTSLTGVSDVVRVNVRNSFRSQLPNQRQQNRQTTDAPVGQGPVRLSDREIAKVWIERPIYLRRSIYTRYGKRGWSSGKGASSPKPYNFEPGGRVLEFRRTQPLTKEPNTVEIPYRFQASNWAGAMIPTPGAVVEIDTDRGEPAETAADSLYYRNLSDTTRLNSVVVVPEEAQITTGARFSASFDNPNDTKPYFETAGTPTWKENPVLTKFDMNDYDRLMALRDAIARTCKYNTQTPAVPNDRDPVDYFLNESKMGYCDLFASAFAVEARRLGYPSRYVTGFLMDGTQLQKDGSYSILEKNSHAWAEVYFEGYGWIAFDATAGAEDVSPEVLDPSSNSFVAGIRKWLIANLALVGGILGVGLLGSVILLSRSRGVQMAGGSGNQKIRTLRHSSTRFQTAMERLVGSPRRFSQTYREFADVHSEPLAPLKTQIDEILPELERAMFSADDLQDEQLAALNGKIADLDKASRQIHKEQKRAGKGKRKPA